MLCCAVPAPWPCCLQVQLILPEALKLLPLYSLALHKSNMLRPDVRADDRSAWLAGVIGASPQRTMGLLHPRLFAVHNLLVGVLTHLHTGASAADVGSIMYLSMCIASEHVIMCCAVVQTRVQSCIATGNE